MVLTDEEKSQFAIEKLAELRATLNMISNWMVLPLYFLFWACDLVYYPQHKWSFLGLRALVVPTCFVVQFYINKIKTFRQGEWLALFFIFVLASIINAMIYTIGDFGTSYYAGLNLVAIGSLTFIPWSRTFFLLGNLSIFGPYYLGAAIYHMGAIGNFKEVYAHTFFIVGTIVITFVIKYFHELLRMKEFKSRMQLNEEIGNRDSLIIEKTNEALRLSSLSSQFSPQIVDAIRANKIKLSGSVQRAQICTLFIDIVNSTERVSRLDKDKVHNAISRFMDDTIKILLKYDITIDKFLGDGVLAFSGAPMPSSDFIQRTLMAACEIRDKVNSRADFYEDNWMNKMEIKVGIAAGYANVGFYGSERYFKSYTAIGPVVNLASRLCSAAHPNQILVASEVVQGLDENQFVSSAVGKLSLKGFESDVIKAYEINPKVGGERNGDNLELDCPKCHTGLLQLDLNADNIYIFKCRSCGHIKDNNSPVAANKKSA